VLRYDLSPGPRQALLLTAPKVTKGAKVKTQREYRVGVRIYRFLTAALFTSVHLLHLSMQRCAVAIEYSLIAFRFIFNFLVVTG